MSRRSCVPLVFFTLFPQAAFRHQPAPVPALYLLFTFLVLPSSLSLQPFFSCPFVIPPFLVVSLIDVIITYVIFDFLVCAVGPPYMQRPPLPYPSGVVGLALLPHTITLNPTEVFRIV